MKGKKNIAYCGIECGAGPAYVATQNDNDVLRAETDGTLLTGLGNT
ncbi:MAG TPA: hypothetical protein VMZ49_08185 [Patescibacteria group bacterium]|nr:hypothetical protein [Patescibacteria group bacterium]